MTRAMFNSSAQILVASMLVTFVLGSVHAFSVFLAPLEGSSGCHDRRSA